MSDWTLTRGLQNLRAQVDAAFPGRDRTSDGTIGDAAHKTRTSGHNPDDTPGSRPAWDGDPDDLPEARAWDMDSDLGDPDVSAQDLVDHIRRLPALATVIRYMIYNRTMYHQRDDFAPTDYTGPSAHTEHVHFEGAWSQSADDNTTFDYKLEELVLTPEDIAKAVWAYKLSNGSTAGGQVVTVGARTDALTNRQVPALLLAAGKDPVDEQALAAALVPALVAALPGVDVTPEALQAALVGALRQLAAPAA
jgi:hypothetical protein